MSIKDRRTPEDMADLALEAITAQLYEEERFEDIAKIMYFIIPNPVPVLVIRTTNQCREEL